MGSNEAWEPKQGLLTEARVGETCKELQNIPDLVLGIKVQPAPATLTIEERLNFLRQQIQAFEKARLSSLSL